MSVARCYCRVSSDQQAESGLGIASQKQAIEKYAATNGIDELHWYIDDGVSGGAPVEERPELARCMDDIRKGEVLLVARRDRLAHDVFMAAWISKELLKVGARCVSCAGEGTESDTLEGRLLTTIIDAFAEYEKGRIVMRTKLAKRSARARGDHIGGSPPYGFRKVRRDGRLKLEPDESEAATIARAKELAENLSWTKTAEKLAEEGHKPRKGKRFHVTQLQRIVGRA